MSVTVTRKDVLFQPDSSRVIARFFFTNEARSIDLIKRVLALTEQQQAATMHQLLNSYKKRHRRVSAVFEKHFLRVLPLLKHLNVAEDHLSGLQKELIGAFFTMEYSIEAAAFFNPSIVPDPDQSGVTDGAKRVIISFRATGEGHVSSIVFRSGIIDSLNNVVIDAPGRLLESPVHIKNHTYHRLSFLSKLEEMKAYNSKAYDMMAGKLTETFTFEELKKYVEETRLLLKGDLESNVVLSEMMWLASSHYEMHFSVDTSLSERVIFPIADTEIKGIEDARFVRFVEDDGEVMYYATYTAYDGISILPKLLLTKDFFYFKVIPVHGEVAQNKGMALFPRKINGKYVMLCRIDGVNNFIAFSDKINIWRHASLLQTPQYPWEFVQMGNCGSPVETPEGWLVITHGVGPLREYSLGVSLLDLDDPEKEIGRLSVPLIVPNEQEREGYVPNVVYSCGSMLHNGSLIIPYAMSDHASTYATVNLDELMDALKK